MTQAPDAPTAASMAAPMDAPRGAPMAGPVAVITGAAQGIGRRITELLSEQGYRLALLDLHEVDGFPGAVQTSGDVTNEAEVADFVAAIHAAYGRIDVLVNNAGIAFVQPTELTAPDLWRRVIEVNLTGPYLLCLHVGRRMLEQRAGSIINIASVAGLLGVADRAAYNASKHGLVGLTRTLAVEWGGRGVRVNAVCPGWVKTPMDDASQGEGLYVDADITDHVPLGRFANPDDVAQAVAFLADSRRSGFINGVTLSVDGGWSADASWQSLRLKTRDR